MDDRYIHASVHDSSGSRASNTHHTDNIEPLVQRSYVVAACQRSRTWIAESRLRIHGMIIRPVQKTGSTALDIKPALPLERHDSSFPELTTYSLHGIDWGFERGPRTYSEPFPTPQPESMPGISYLVRQGKSLYESCLAAVPSRQPFKMHLICAASRKLPQRTCLGCNLLASRWCTEY
jgi:hypothetical protein